ncbi:MAG: U32 family peptidase [Alphaproteobacteria bacterium]|nr:U32 family peptidase [Alphaproteobacteria bacterium]
MKQELLAPAGDIEAGYAALYYGADAVYLGLKRFSARAGAVNFSEGELDEFTAYAHSLKRKVYVTINTLIQECELKELMQTLDICSNCKVDGIILQDLGVAGIICKYYPELELHASTQMAVHNRAGALALQKLGFKRVVLARELSLAEIKDIASISGLETEAFIHGALCYSYSGLCLFSSLDEGRSANRGKCMYPCRQEFKAGEEQKHWFSMKDMALSADVLKLPVTSLKIEGRKKNALYVAAVTDYYRNILDGHGSIVKKEENIKQIFSRPWCKFMLHGKDKSVVDRDFVGHRGLFIGKVEEIFPSTISFKTSHKIARHDGLQIETKKQEKPFGFAIKELRINKKSVFEAEAGERVFISLPPNAAGIVKGDKIYLASSSEVKGSYDYVKPKTGEYKNRFPINVELTVTPLLITAKALQTEVSIKGEFPKAEEESKTFLSAQKAFAKTGDTEFVLEKLQFDNPQGLFVPISMLNELRRMLYAKLRVSKKQISLPLSLPLRDKTSPKWIVRSDNLANLALIDVNEINEVEVVISPEFEAEKLQTLPKAKVRIVLPALARNYKSYARIIEKLIAAGYKKWCIGNFWAREMLPQTGIDLSFDMSIYTLNTQSILFAQKAGSSRVCLSVEDTLENWQSLGEYSPLPLVLPIYQDVLLFSSAVCIRNNPCSQCPRGKKIINLQKGEEKYIAISENCQTFVISQRAFCAAQEAMAVNADFYRVDFCYREYDAKTAAKIWQAVRSFTDIPHCRKGNLKNRNF